jgi:hypothetical protein
MQKIKKSIKFLIPLLAMLLMSMSAYAYDTVNLPESMSFSEAIGIYNASDVTRATLSDPTDNKYIEMTRDEIEEFFSIASNMKLTRTINATPFRGTAVNFYTESGVRSYYLNSGVQIGMYGTVTYICYQADDVDAGSLMYLDTIYKDEPIKSNGESIHVQTNTDYLKMPQDKWAQTTITDAASHCLVPYEFVNKYSDNITREEFCILLGNTIRVSGNYVSLDEYMKSQGKAYLTNYFTDCSGVDSSVNILYALGVVNGKTETEFDPDGIINREEAAALICRAAALFRYVDDDDTLYYDDARDISQWARPFVAWVSNRFIMNGTDGSFLPQKAYTVQEAITTVNRLYKVITK